MRGGIAWGRHALCMDGKNCTLLYCPLLPAHRPPHFPLCLPACLQLEMILQAHEYEGAQGKVLQEFFDSTAGKWRTDLGQSWAEEIYARRSQRQQQQQQAAGSGDGAAAAESNVGR